jgi:hypothetical protein
LDSDRFTSGELLKRFKAIAFWRHVFELNCDDPQSDLEMIYFGIAIAFWDLNEAIVFLLDVLNCDRGQ